MSNRLVVVGGLAPAGSAARLESTELALYGGAGPMTAEKGGKSVREAAVRERQA